MSNTWLLLVFAGALLEASFMAWTRLPGLLPEYDIPRPPRTLQAYFPHLKYGGGLPGIAAILAALLGTPPRYLGVDMNKAVSVGPEALAIGIGLGVLLYITAALMIPIVNAYGLAYEPGYEQIRQASPGGFLAFLCVQLPAISLREELIFRIGLIGVPAILLGVSPWLLVVVSTLVFGAVHFTGDGGVVIAGILGVFLAIGFVLTNSLLAIIVAHTIANAAEFIVHDQFEANPGNAILRSRLESN